MTKIAYVFHGHARTWERCYEAFFENVYSVFPGDIFIHTWDITNAKVGSYWNGWSTLSKELLDKSTQPIDVARIKNVYKPKVLVVEEDRGVDTTGYPEHPRMEAYLGAKNMLYSARKSFTHATGYDNYDRIFSTRMDILYENKFDIEELNDTSLICSNHGHPSNIAFDLWMHGTPEHINIKTEYLYYIDEMFLKNPYLDMLWYEHVFSQYLHSRNVQFKKSSLNCSIPRINGTISKH